MSADLNPAELRKLQRERRAAKMAKGGSRLNKILGSSDIAEISEKTIKPEFESNTVDIPKNSILSTTSAEACGNVEEPQLKLRTNKTSENTKKNRISAILIQDNDEDPPVSSLDEYDEPEISLESTDSPLQEFESEENIEKDMENLLNKILQGSARDPHGHGQPITNDQKVNNSDISSMFPSVMPNIPNMPIFPGMSGMPGMGDMFGQSGKSELDIAKAKLFKSGFSIARFIIVWIIVWSHVEKLAMTSLYFFPPNTKLWTHFLCIEILLGGIYLLLSYFSIFPNHTILSFDISSFGYPNSLLTSYGLVKGFFADFCCMIVTLGFLFYIGS